MRQKRTPLRMQGYVFASLVSCTRLIVHKALIPLQRKRCRGMSALWTIKRVHETNEAKTYACMRKGVLCKSSPVWRSGRELCSTSTFLGTYIVQWKQVNRER